MDFSLPEYKQPDFTKELFSLAPDAAFAEVEMDGVAPENYHATTIFPEYFKLKNEWTMISESRMDSVVVVKENRQLEVREFRNLKSGDQVIVGRTEDGSEGIYVHTDGFKSGMKSDEHFVFRTGRSRETSFSRDYDYLYDLLKYEKEHGYIVWALGPAVSFDFDSRKAMASLIENGYAKAILAGNALATHDLEGAVFKTALGQNIYTQVPIAKGHYHHLELINKARSYGSLEKMIQKEDIQDGIIHACFKNHVPFVLAGSIRDDGPLPGVIGDVYAAQDEMRKHTRRATTLIGLATQLHTIAAGNMTPAFQKANGAVRPVFIYTIDISEFAVNKLRDRGTLEVTSIVTNVQDFLVNLERSLIKNER